MDLLPSRPLSLHPRFAITRLLIALTPSLALAGLGLCALTLTAEDAARLVSQDAIARSGVAAVHPRIDIERDGSLLLFRARRYEVAFEEADGTTRHATVREHDLSISALVVEGPPEVRYDPSDASRIAVGFARQNVGAQWGAVALLGAVGALALLAAGLLFARLSRPWRAARAARAAREERAARITASEPLLDSRGRPTGACHLTLALEAITRGEAGTYREQADGGRAHVSTVGLAALAALGEPPFDLVTSAEDPPLYLDAEERSVLVVRAGTLGGPIVVRRSGYPFVLSEVERSELAARLEALTGRAREHEGAALFCQTPARP